MGAAALFNVRRTLRLTTPDPVTILCLNFAHTISLEPILLLCACVMPALAPDVDLRQAQAFWLQRSDVARTRMGWVSNEGLQSKNL